MKKHLPAVASLVLLATSCSLPKGSSTSSSAVTSEETSTTDIAQEGSLMAHVRAVADNVNLTPSLNEVLGQEKENALSKKGKMSEDDAPEIIDITDKPYNVEGRLITTDVFYFLEDMVKDSYITSLISYKDKILNRYYMLDTWIDTEDRYSYGNNEGTATKKIRIGYDEYIDKVTIESVVNLGADEFIYYSITSSFDKDGNIVIRNTNIRAYADTFSARYFEYHQNHNWIASIYEPQRFYENGEWVYDIHNSEICYKDLTREKNDYFVLTNRTTKGRNNFEETLTGIHYIDYREDYIADYQLSIQSSLGNTLTNPYHYYHVYNLDGTPMFNGKTFQSHETWITTFSTINAFAFSGYDRILLVKDDEHYDPDNPYALTFEKDGEYYQGNDEINMGHYRWVNWLIIDPSGFANSVEWSEHQAPLEAMDSTQRAAYYQNIYTLAEGLAPSDRTCSIFAEIDATAPTVFDERFCDEVPDNYALGFDEVQELIRTHQDHIDFEEIRGYKDVTPIKENQQRVDTRNLREFRAPSVEGLVRYDATTKELDFSALRFTLAKSQLLATGNEYSIVLSLDGASSSIALGEASLTYQGEALVYEGFSNVRLQDAMNVLYEDGSYKLNATLYRLENGEKIISSISIGLPGEETEFEESHHRTILDNPRHNDYDVVAASAMFNEEACKFNIAIENVRDLKEDKVDLHPVEDHVSFNVDERGLHASFTLQGTIEHYDYYQDLSLYLVLSDINGNQHVLADQSNIIPVSSEDGSVSMQVNIDIDLIDLYLSDIYYITNISLDLMMIEEYDGNTLTHWNNLINPVDISINPFETFVLDINQDGESSQINVNCGLRDGQNVIIMSPNSNE